MSRIEMIGLSFLEAALLVVILGIGLNQVRKRLTIISNGLGTLGGALATVPAPARPGEVGRRHQRAARGHRRRPAGDRLEGRARRAQGASEIGER
jgi:hypothetical protein